MPGATLCYRKKSRFWRENAYSEDRFPVLDISRGGAKFLSNDRPKVGLRIDVRIYIPEASQPLEMAAVVCWVGINPEFSYRFQIGIAFAPYGSWKNANPPALLGQIKKLESAYSTETDVAPGRSILNSRSVGTA